MKTLITFLCMSALVGCSTNCGVTISSQDASAPDATVDAGVDPSTDGATGSLLQSSSNATAEVYGGYCCDGNGVRRCVINPSPFGSECYCYGQGYGWVCL